MGCGDSTSNTTVPVSSNGKFGSVLRVGTLNYCGIMNSPFQFFSDDFIQEMEDLSRIFMETIPEYVPNFDKTKFSWKMGKLDLKFRTGRYSPMFHLDVGILQTKQDHVIKKRFMTRQEFETKWEQVYKAGSPSYGIAFTEQQRTETKLYDVIAFHSFLKYVYNIKKLTQAEGKDPELYIKKFQPFFNLSFLDQEKKLKKVISYIPKLNADVFFFQEYSENLHKHLQSINEYYISVDSTKDTMVIAKKSTFSNLKDTNSVFGQISKQLRDSLNWASRTSFLIVDNYILLGAHLHATAQKNKPQIEQLRKSVIQLSKALPSYSIIVGGDLNSYLQPFESTFFSYPGEQKVTTIKKRTMTQGQFHKGNKKVEESKDKIISTLKIIKGSINYINGKEPKAGSLVPTDEHPFDHFMVLAQLQRKN